MADFLACLHDKYAAAEVDNNDDKFQFVGAAELSSRMSDHKSLRVVALDGCGLTKLCAPGQTPAQVAQNVPAVAELDLALNSLSDLPELLRFAAALPALTELNVRGNQLAVGDGVRGEVGDEGRMPALRALAVSDMKPEMGWSEVVTLCSFAPALERLVCCGNKIASLQFPAEFGSHALDTLTFIQLDNNNLAEWGALDPLAKLPKLQALFLNNNPLTSVAHSEHDADKFAALRTLSLSSTRIDSPESVHALNTFPQLTHVNLMDTPVFGLLARPSIIARCQRLTKLNNSEITPKERNDSEHWFVRHHKPSDAESAFVNSLVEQLREKWNLNDEDVAKGSSASYTTAASLIEIELRPVAISICEKPPTKKRVPDTLPVAALRMLCARLFGIPADKQILRHLARESPVPEELSDNAVDIGKLMIKEGSVILIDEK